MANEYLNYNSKKNPHWGKQPRGYYFSEIKSWREDLDTDYDIEVPQYAAADAPPVSCVDHSNPKPVPGSNENFRYLQAGKDVITQGLERLQGIEPENPTPSGGGQSGTDQNWLHDIYIPNILHIINEQYSYDYSTYFYTNYNNSDTDALVIFDQMNTYLYVSGIIISNYKHFYLIDGNGTIFNTAENPNNDYVYNYENGYISVSPEEWNEDIVYGSISGGLETMDSFSYPVILLATP